MTIDLPQRKPEKYRLLKEVFFLIAMTAVGYILFSGLGIRLAVYFYDVDMTSLVSGDFSNATLQLIKASKFIQIFVTTGTFLLPAMLFPYYLGKNPVSYTGIDKNISLLLVFQVILLLVLIYPFVDWLIAVNSKFTLPQFLGNLENALKTQEEHYVMIQDTFMRMDNVRDLAANILVLALVPAFLEELYFRGMFQTWMNGLLKNHHWAILISALLFSLVHFRFYGILPIIVLGIILGYLFYWTGSLWASILAHFLNNASAVILVFLSQKNIIDFQMDKPMNSSNLVIIGSFALAALFFLVLASYYNKRRDKTRDWIKILTTTDVTRAEILKGKLENMDIPAVIINKRDSTYQVFGPVELYVNPEDEAAAIQIINQEETSEIQEKENE